MNNYSQLLDRHVMATINTDHNLHRITLLFPRKLPTGQISGAGKSWLPYPGGGQWTSCHQHVLQDNWMVAPLHHRLDSVPAFLYTLCIHGVQRVRSSSSTKRECGVRTECAFLIEPISGNSDGRLSTTHDIADDT